MELRDVLRIRDHVTRFRELPLDAARLRGVLEAAAGTPTFADQSALRLVVVEDAATKAALRRACETLRARWYADAAPWAQRALERGGEPRQLALLSEAPAVVCVFGEVDKPFWRESAWSAAARLQLAALAEGWRAVPVRAESFDYLNALLGVPQDFAAVVVLALGEPEATSAASGAADLQDVLLPHEPSALRLECWNDPVRLAELESSPELRARPFLSDKQLVLNLIETAADIHACHDADTIFALVTRELRRIFRYDRASIAYIDPADGKLRLRDIHKEYGLPAGEQLEIPLSDEHVIGWVILNKSGVCRGDIDEEDTFTTRVHETGLRSDMVVPLLTGGRVLGTLNLGSARPHTFTQSDFDVLRELGRLVAAAVERSNLFEETRCLAAFDALTGLYNHRHFQARLLEEVERSRRYGLACGLLLLDVDHFGVLNSTFGHEVGDSVLASLAQTLKENVRSVDVVSRFGGEEFAILVAETHSEALHVLAERLRTVIESRAHALARDNVAVRTTVSIGGCVQMGSELQRETLLSRAETALYRAKCLGRNRVCLHGPAATAPGRYLHHA